VTKLQFIRIKTDLVHIGRRRTTSLNENDIHRVPEKVVHEAHIDNLVNS